MVKKVKVGTGMIIHYFNIVHCLFTSETSVTT